ncbi:MAG TPA: thermostable hemolysin, partial [Burkholderiales bacterium]|nr:thermostable hemolysin [Burkholderiales bacterium]
MHPQPALALEPTRTAAAAARRERRTTAPTSEVRVDLTDTFDPARPVLEQFIRESFAAAYGARVEAFMPKLMSVLTPAGDIIAVCGLRDPRNGPLFLESYLERPVEAVLERVAGRPVSRRGLTEVGNLAIARPGFARFLIAALTEHLHDTGQEWAVFTAVPALRNAFSRLGIELVTLGPARISSLPARDRAKWGT